MIRTVTAGGVGGKLISTIEASHWETSLEIVADLHSS
jgi:hypothetical protein